MGSDSDNLRSTVNLKYAQYDWLASSDSTDSTWLTKILHFFNTSTVSLMSWNRELVAMAIRLRQSFSHYKFWPLTRNDYSQLELNIIVMFALISVTTEFDQLSCSLVSWSDMKLSHIMTDITNIFPLLLPRAQRDPVWSFTSLLLISTRQALVRRLENLYHVCVWSSWVRMMERCLSF